ASHAVRGVRAAHLRPPQVDVEVAARIARIAVQEEALAGAVELARRLRARRRVSVHTERGLAHQRGRHQGPEHQAYPGDNLTRSSGSRVHVRTTTVARALLWKLGVPHPRSRNGRRPPDKPVTA